MVQSASERNRVLYVLKSRGMAHSNQMREFVLSDKGIDLVDVYVGPGAVYTGAARLTQEAHDKAEALMQQQASARHERELEHERHGLQTKLDTVIAEQEFTGKLEQQRTESVRRIEAELAKVRRADRKES